MMRMGCIIWRQYSLTQPGNRALVPAHHCTIAGNIVPSLPLFQRGQAKPLSSLVNGMRPIDAQDDSDAGQSSVK